MKSVAAFSARDFAALRGQFHCHVHAFVGGDDCLAGHARKAFQRQRAHIQRGGRGRVLARQIHHQRRHLGSGAAKAQVQRVARAPPILEPLALDRLHFKLRGKRERHRGEIVAFREKLKRRQQFDLPAIDLIDVVHARLPLRRRQLRPNTRASPRPAYAAMSLEFAHAAPFHGICRWPAAGFGVTSSRSSAMIAVLGVVQALRRRGEDSARSNRREGEATGAALAGRS